MLRRRFNVDCNCTKPEPVEILQIIYRSTAALPADIDDILAVSRENNQQDRISGYLLFDGQAYAQIIEGPPEVTWERYMRISRDDRHFDIKLLRMSSRRRSRNFEGWSMGYYQSAPMAAFGQVPLSSASPDEIMRAARNFSFADGVSQRTMRKDGAPG